MFHVEKMTTVDLPLAVDLANTMHWNTTQEDFELNLKLEPEGCLVLLDELGRVGISTCVSFGKVGWFGNLVMKKDHRRQGGGTLLVQRAINYLKSKGVETIGLYAYQHLVGFYENIGFRGNEEFSVFQGKTKTRCAQSSLKKITGKDIPAVLDFDRKCFRGDREKLLEPIILNENNRCYFAERNGRLTGYVIAKNHEEMTDVGPLVCRNLNNNLAKSLLRAALCDFSGREVFVCLPTRNRNLTRVIAGMGLNENFRVTRMFLGPATAESCTYIPESLERG